MRIDITYDILTEESVEQADAAERGWIDPATDYQVDDRPESSWTLREAIKFMSEHTVHIETDWTPENNRLGMSLYGNGERSPGSDPLETDHCMHVKGLSLGSMMRLARLLAYHGVDFANMQSMVRAQRASKRAGQAPDLSGFRERFVNAMHRLSEES